MVTLQQKQPTDPAARELVWRQAFERLAQAQGDAEVTGLSESSEDQLAPVFHTRLLVFDHRQFVIERPNDPEAYHYFQAGSHVAVILSDDSGRWQATTTVLRLVKHPINVGFDVTAVSLTQPKNVRSAQRRESFRVSARGLDLDHVWFTPIPQEMGPNPIIGSPPNQRFTATIRNIGGGGMAVAVDKNLIQQLEHLHQYLVKIKLPTMAQAMIIRARLLRIQPMENALYLGVNFEFESNLERNQFENEICQFAIGLQNQSA